MPGREANAPHAVSSRVASAPYARPVLRAPGDSTPPPTSSGTAGDAPRRPAEAGFLVSYSATSMNQGRGGRGAAAGKECLPVCARCAEAHATTQRVIEAYRQLLRHCKSAFLTDVAAHYAGDELWLRVLDTLEERPAAVRSSSSSE